MSASATHQQVKSILSSASSLQEAIQRLQPLANEPVHYDPEYIVGDLIDGLRAVDRLGNTNPSTREVHQVATYVTTEHNLRNKAIALFEQQYGELTN